MSFWIDGKVAWWLRSYLVGRKQQVVIDGVSSDPSTLQFGVSKCPWTSSLDLINQCCGWHLPCKGASFQIYADITQNYLAFSLEEISVNFARMQHSVAQVTAWMTYNVLKLNTDKTEIIFSGAKAQLCCLRQSRPEAKETFLDGGYDQTCNLSLWSGLLHGQIRKFTLIRWHLQVGPFYRISSE